MLYEHVITSLLTLGYGVAFALTLYLAIKGFIDWLTWYLERRAKRAEERHVFLYNQRQLEEARIRAVDNHLGKRR